jgi:prepilin-type N-terminal cleavage/methylation domain-containing protein
MTPIHKTPRIVTKADAMNHNPQTHIFPPKPRMQVAWASRPYFPPSTPTCTCRLRLASSPRGFTLIELLVVIGIILVLIGLFFAGAKIVTAQAKERDTKTALETCKTLFANYVQATHLARIPAGLPSGYSWSTSQELASTVLTDSAYVMYAVESLPENQTIMTNIPPTKLTTVTIQVGSGGVNGTTATVNVPLLLDAWGNTIAFVPGGGLSGVWQATAPPAPEVVTSEGVKQAPFTVSGTATPYKPFFVSAGPDGDFSNSANQTEDNIYSFSN